MRDSRPIKRSPLSRLSIRNHLSPATSFAQWLMGLHRPWVPAHYLVHTAPLFKHKGRNMKHCFRRCLWVKKKKNLFIVGLEKKASWPFLVMWTHEKTLAAILVQNEPDESNPFIEKNHRFKSNELRLKDWLFLKQTWRCTRQNSQKSSSHIWIRKGYLHKDPQQQPLVWRLFNCSNDIMYINPLMSKDTL